MRGLHAAWLLVPLAIAAVDVRAQSLLTAPVARPVTPSATMLARPALAPALPVARAADHVQVQDAAIDDALARFAAANAGNPGVAAALDAAAAELARNPGAYLNADGSANKNAMQGLVGQRCRDAGAVSLPSADGADVAYPDFGAASEGDIEALAFIIMMQEAKSARDDLKAIMEATKAANDRKAAQRDAMRAGKQAMQDAKDGAQDDRDAAKGGLDTLSDMGEQDQLHLQLAMDRYWKAMSTLSNLMHKQGDTASAIIGNMK